MTIGRGPGGKRHVPEHRSGCYYGRMESCCVLCTLRIVIGVLLGIARLANPLRGGRDAPDHGPAGDRITVPALHRADDRDAVDRVSGEATASFDMEQEPDVVTVRLDDGTELAFTIERVD